MSTENAGTIYLITGASRGIGLAIVRELAARASADSKVTILAAARTPSSAPLLDEVRKAYPDVAIEVVPYIAADVASNEKLAAYVKEKYGRVDTVVANAGIGNYIGPVTSTPLAEMRSHWEVNALGPLLLLQAFVPLLKASKDPKFIPITSGAGSSAYSDVDLGHGAYGSSKAAVNFITKRAHVEEPWLIAFPLAPGIIETDMSRHSRETDKTGTMAKLQDEMGMTPEQGGKLLVDIITQATRETHGGQYVNVDGSRLPW